MVDHGAGGSPAVLKCSVTFHAADKVPHLLKAVPNRTPSPPRALHVWCHWLMSGSNIFLTLKSKLMLAPPLMANMGLLGAMKDQFMVSFTKANSLIEIYSEVNKRIISLKRYF